MKWLRDELAAMLFALQMLSIVPIPAALEFTARRQASSVGYYPLAGAVIGLVAASVYALAHLLFPAPTGIPVLLSMLAGALVTGAFHEDGLADTIDGLGGADADTSLAIMRDSRIGTYGAAALLLALAIKAATLLALPAAALAAILFAAHAISRCSAVLVVASSRYADLEADAKPTARGIGPAGLCKALAVSAAVVAFSLVAIPQAAMLGGLAGLALGHVSSRLLYERRLGGYTGDCLGATQQCSELGFYLGLLAAW